MEATSRSAARPADGRRWARPVQGLAIAAACAVVGVLSAAQIYYTDRAEGEHVVWRTVLAHQLTYWTAWTVLLPVVAAAARRIAQLGRASQQLAVHAVIGTWLALLQSGLAFSVRLVAEPTVAHVSGFWPYARGWLFFNLVTYAALVAGVLAGDHWRLARAQELRAAHLDTELSRARLRTLQMQLRPHFLFNTLNTVAMLIRTSDGQRALSMLAGLGDVLRHTLDDDAPHEVPLREELEFLRGYLDIERVRFHDRLCIDIDVAPEALEAHVPRFVLQPLVENAIRHGIEKRPGSGRVALRAGRDADRLELTVWDDGPGPATESAAGIGLGNARERLRHLYGDRAHLSLVAVARGGALATISLPWHTGPVDTVTP